MRERMQTCRGRRVKVSMKATAFDHNLFKGVPGVSEDRDPDNHLSLEYSKAQQMILYPV